MASTMGTAVNEVRQALTEHAEGRMYARGLCTAQLDMVLRYGRLIHIRGASVHVIGRREVDYYRRRGIHLEPCEGLQVVCGGNGQVLTVYRNQDFRGLRPNRKHPRHP